jgi:ABC-type transporter Mla maintaining outer membrane lipid asymmetry permease subunit MlaE
MFPVLVVFGDLLAVLGGLFGAVIVAHIPAGAFVAGMKSSFLTRDALFGLTKATIFGYTITSIASYQGYYVAGGSAGRREGDDVHRRPDMPCRRRSWISYSPRLCSE